SPGFGRLFESVSDSDQLWFAKRTAEERDSHRQSKNITRGHGDVRITCYCRGRRITTGEVIAVGPISWPRWSTSRRDQRVEPVLLHHEVDTLRACEQVILAQRLQV